MKIIKFSGFPVICLCIMALVTTYVLAAGEEEGASASRTQSREILMNMGKFMSQTQRFSVTVLSGYDVVQETGQKIEFNDNRKVTVSRPDHLRMEVEKSNGAINLAVIDGKNIRIATTTDNESVYAESPSPGDLDASIKYLVKDLNMRLPLAVLLVSNLPEEFEKRVQAIDYVEKTRIFGAPAHHLEGSTDTVDFQIWVRDGDQPLPLRIILTYSNEEGQPQFRALFSEWNLSPEITDSTFAFKPPDGAKKISFLAKLNEAGIKAKEPAAAVGEQPAGEQP